MECIPERRGTSQFIINAQYLYIQYRLYLEVYPGVRKGESTQIILERAALFTKKQIPRIFLYNFSQIVFHTQSYGTSLQFRPKALPNFIPKRLKKNPPLGAVLTRV